MRKKTRGIIIPPESRQGIKRLTQAQKGDLLDAIYAYNIDGEIIATDPVVGMAFDMMKDFFDNAIQEYEKTCKQNSEIMKERWRKEKEQKEGYEPIQSDTTVYEPIQSDTNATNKDKVNINKINKIKPNQNKTETDTIVSELSLEVAEKKEYGNPEINSMLALLRKSVGVSTFSESEQVQRNLAKHMMSLGEKIGRDEFLHRLKSILSDPFKLKNSNKINYLYREIKSFIHSPVVELKNPEPKTRNGIGVIQFIS